MTIPTCTQTMPHHVSQNQSHKAPNKSGKNIGTWCVCGSVVENMQGLLDTLRSWTTSPWPTPPTPNSWLPTSPNMSGPPKVRHRARQKVATSSSSQPPMNLVPKKRQRPGSLKLPRPGSPTDSEFLVPDSSKMSGPPTRSSIGPVRKSQHLAPPTSKHLVPKKPLPCG